MVTTNAVGTLPKKTCVMTSIFAGKFAWCWYIWFSAKGHHVCDFQWGLAVLTKYQPEILFHQSIKQFADGCTHQELKNWHKLKRTQYTEWKWERRF